jgi:hypothetical protein
LFDATEPLKAIRKGPKARVRGIRDDAIIDYGGPYGSELFYFSLLSFFFLSFFFFILLLLFYFLSFPFSFVFSSACEIW